MNGIQNLVEEFNKFQEEFRQKAQEEFKNVFREYWQQNPKVYAVVWQQFTPYFNDGDPCEFSVHDLEPMTKELFDEWQEEGGWPEEYSLIRKDYDIKKPDGTNYSWDNRPWKLPDETWTQEEVNNAACIRQLNSEAMEHIFLAMFGDHVRVIATRDGFDTEDIQHD